MITVSLNNIMTLPWHQISGNGRYWKQKNNGVKYLSTDIQVKKSINLCKNS